MKKETQTTLFKVNNNTTNLGVFNLSKKVVLELFYLDFSDTGLSLVELERKLLNRMSCNTISRSLDYLKKAELIGLTAKNVGPTKRRKYYKITERGTVAYETFK